MYSHILKRAKFTKQPWSTYGSVPPGTELHHSCLGVDLPRSDWAACPLCWAQPERVSSILCQRCEQHPLSVMWAASSVTDVPELGCSSSIHAQVVQAHTFLNQTEFLILTRCIFYRFLFCSAIPLSRYHQGLVKIGCPLWVNCRWENWDCKLT